MEFELYGKGVVEVAKPEVGNKVFFSGKRR